MTLDKPEPRSSELTAIISRQALETPSGDVTYMHYIGADR